MRLVFAFLALLLLAACNRREPSADTEDTRGGIAATFEAEGTGKKTKAKIKWSGTSTGRDITGAMTWTKPDGSVVEFTFKGEKIN